MDQSQTKPPSAPVQDVNATVDPNQPIETPVDIGIQIEGYEPPPGNDQYGQPPPPPPSAGFNKRLIIVAVLIVVLLISLSVGIFLAVRPKKVVEQIVLTYWGLWEEEAVMQTVINDYQSSHPNITIQYSMQSPKEYRQRLQAAISRGEGPDIFRFHNTWVPMIVKELAPIPEAAYPYEEFKKTFYPIASRDLTVNNQLVGIPIMIDGLVMYYNATLLDEAGVAIPSTWDEFEAAVQKMTVKNEAGEIVIAGAALGTTENIEHFSDIVGLMLYQNSADPSNVKMPSLSGGEAIQALTYYALFAQPPNNVWDAKQGNSIVAFAGGKVAFIFAPSWEIFAVKAMSPDLVFGVAPVPQLTGANKVTWGTYWVEGVSSGSKYQAEAVEFITYLSSRDVMTKLFAESSKTRLFGNPYSRTDLADEMRKNNFLVPIVDSAPHMYSWYVSSRTQDEGINDRIIAYFRNALNAIYQGSSPEGELQTVSAGVTQVMSDYSLTPP